MTHHMPNSAIAQPVPNMKTRRRQWGTLLDPAPASPILHPDMVKSHGNAPSPSLMPSQSQKSNLPIVLPKPTNIESLLAGQLSTETKRAYRADLKAFLVFLGHPDALERPERFLAVLRIVDRMKAAEYRDHMLHNEKKAAATVARRMTAIHTAFDMLKEEGLIDKNPLSRVKRPKVSNEGRSAALTREQIERLLAQPDISTPMGRRDRVVLLLLFFCGLRRSEVVRIETDDFFMTQGHAMVWIYGKGRSDKSDSVLIPDSVWPEVKAFVDGCGKGLLFTGQSRNRAYNLEDKSLSTNRIYLMFKKYCRSAGIDPQGYSPHSTRASFITLCLSGGADVRSTMYAARHSDPSTTIRYDRQRMNLADHASSHLSINVVHAK